MAEEENTSQAENENESSEQATETAARANSEQAEDGLGEAGKKALDQERAARREAEKRLKETESKVQEFEDRNKSDLERVTAKGEKLSADFAEVQLRYLRLKVSTEKGLPTDLADRLKGETEEEMAADADRLIEVVRPKAATDFDGGVRRDAEPKLEPGLPRLAHAYAQNEKK